MSFDPTTAVHLKPWLVRTLEPICDAEPGALADYILALLKHNAPEAEMRKELLQELDEFLEKECAPFIDSLFSTLRSKSYLPYTAASPTTPSPISSSPDNGIPIPLDGLISPLAAPEPIPVASERDRRKRSQVDDERDGRAPSKGPRLSADGMFSRYDGRNGRGPSHDSRSTGGWNARPDRDRNGGHSMMNGGNAGGNVGGMGAMMGANGNALRSGPGPPHSYQPPEHSKRGICRDYHNNGYCSRGAFCKFSHGEDAVVPNQLFPMNPAQIQAALPFLPLFANGGMPFGMMNNSGAYDPHEARMDMHPQGRHQRVPLLPRTDGGSQLNQTSGELPVIQDLTPTMPSNTNTPNHPPGTNEDYSMSDATPQVSPFPMNNQILQPSMNGMDIDFPMGVVPHPHPQNHHPHSNNFRNNRSNGRGRGGSFFAEAHTFRPERRTDKTLVVEKIPEDHLSLEAVNGWFKRFGTVTNVAIDAPNGKALVSFSTHDEAHGAWKTEEAVFGNRFVKLFWHRPMEGHGQVGQRMLAASAPMVANIGTQESVKPAATQVANTATPRKVASIPSKSVTAMAEKQKMLEQQIAQQKSLMERLSTASAEERKTIMARLRKLGEEMMPSTPSSVTQAAKPAMSLTPHEDLEKERLDKELDIHSATVAAEGEGSGTTEDLKATLEKLKAEAASLGLPEANSSYQAPSYRPYRGRGRGSSRAYYRGAARGGPPRASMKLDNRPKKLLLKGAGEEALQAVRDYYGLAGQLDSLETIDGDLVASFKTRAAAEQALAKGPIIPNVGQVRISWATGQSTASSTPLKGTTALPKPPSMDEDPQPIRAPSPGPEPLHPGALEEEIESGWGGGDGDGMGMF